MRGGQPPPPSHNKKGMKTMQNNKKTKEVIRGLVKVWLNYDEKEFCEKIIGRDWDKEDGGYSQSKFKQFQKNPLDFTNEADDERLDNIVKAVNDIENREKHIKYNIYAKRKIKGLANVVWQMLFNYPDRDCAFTGLIEGIGIADRGKKGYSQTMVDLGDYNSNMGLADELNQTILGITDQQASEIVLSTIHAIMPKKTIWYAGTKCRYRETVTSNDDAQALIDSFTADGYKACAIHTGSDHHIYTGK